MGVHNNEAVIATTWDFDAIEKIRLWVTQLENSKEIDLFSFSPSLVDICMQTIFLAPDGSKKGWKESMQGFNLRIKFIDELKKFDNEDGSNPFSWVEVGWGEYGQMVLRGNNVNAFNDKTYAILKDEIP